MTALRGLEPNLTRQSDAEAMRRALPYVRELLDRQSQLQRVAGISGHLESGLVS